MFKRSSVKAARTGLTSTQPKKALAGALDDFLIAYLMARAVLLLVRSFLARIRDMR